MKNLLFAEQINSPYHACFTMHKNIKAEQYEFFTGTQL